jgi:diadenylate cyclase
MEHFVALTYEFFSWRTALDILLMAAGLFFLFRTLLRLGTWKIMVGILVALMIFIVANALNLRGIEWVYHNVSNVALLGLIIIFQPELRKILEKAVLMPSRRIKPLNKTLQFVIGESLMKLASARCGALIVFPGTDPIADKILGGHQLNALPSIPLILSIFDSSSPGHDGAVIVEGGKLARFGVRLPMSQSATLSEEYGTRHHAAMGLAEETDALVLVVSEERGQASAFSHGKIRLVSSAQEVSQLIVAHQTTMGFLSGDTKVHIRKRTIWQMAISLLFAIVFWSTLTMTQHEVVERVLPVSIDYTTPAEDLVLVGEKANEIKLYLSGPKSDLDNLTNNPPSVKIDLSKMSKGAQTVLITSENLILPKTITLRDTLPQQLKLMLATVVEKEVQIKPQLIGKLPGTLKIKSITVIPDSVLVTVPLVKDEKIIDEVFTTPIDLTAISSNDKINCKVLARPTIKPVGKKWPDVEVFIELK